MAHSEIKTRSLEESAVKEAKIDDLAVTNAKLAGSIANAKLVNSSVTFNGITVALGASGSIVVTDTAPTITTSSFIAEPETNTTLTLNGTAFVSIPKVEIVSSTGAVTTAPTVSFTSATALDFTTGTGLAAGTFFIRVINPDGGTVTSASAILTVSPGPAWVTASGSLGSVAGGGSVSFTVDATDATSYAKQSGTFPGGVTINSSTGVISGTESGSTSTTVYTFTIRATDAEAQTADREFSITISHGLEQGMAFVQEFIMAATYLSRNQGTPTGDGKKATVSFWMNPSYMTIGSGTFGLWEIRDPSITASFDIAIDNGQLWYGVLQGSWIGSLIPNWRPYNWNAWSHIVGVYDSAQANDYDRMIMYVNGKNVRTEYGGYSTETYVAQDTASTALAASSSYTQKWGRYADTSTYIWDGYMAQCIFVDGEAYQASTFGSTDATTGEWKPKSDGEIRSAVTFGDQGSLLPFSDASNLGYDYQTAGRSTTNDFTVTGSGFKTLENPSNMFPVLNNKDNYYVNSTYTNGNTTITTPTSAYTWATTTLGVSKGKWYFENYVSTGASTTENMTGIAAGPSINNAEQLGGEPDTYSYYGGGQIWADGSAAVSAMPTYTAGDYIGCAFDLDNNKIYWHKNGTYINSGDPSAGTGGQTITAPDAQTFANRTGFYFAAVGDYSSTAGGVYNINMGNGVFGTTALSGTTYSDSDGQGIFKYTVPTGYKCINTKQIKTYG